MASRNSNSFGSSGGTVESAPKSSVRAGLINARSSDAHLSELRLVCREYKFDFFGITETFLRPELPDAFLNIQGYELVRCDRGFRRGGGVCLYIKKYIKYEVILKKASTNLECLVVKLSLSSSSLVVGVFYRAPNIPFLSFFEEFESIVSGVADARDIVLMGDFNIDPSAFASNFRRFESMLSSYNVSLVESPPTRLTEASATTLDRFAISDLNKVRALTVYPVSSIADHELVVLDMKYEKPLEVPVVRYHRDLNRINVSSLLSDVQSHDWSSVYLAVGAESKVSNLQTILKSWLDHYAPLKMTTFMPCNATPVDSELCRLVEMREVAYRLWRSRRRRRRGDLCWREFKRLSLLVKVREETLESRRVERKFRGCDTLQELWRKLKSEGLGKQGVRASTPFTPDQFNSNFVGSVTGPQPSIIFNHNESFDGFSFSLVEEDMVFGAVMSVKSDAVGDDGLPLKFIKLILPDLLPILTHVLNHVIMTSSFPSLWKTALVVPIPKSSGPAQVSDFRPISILPVLSKVMEKLLFDQMLEHLNTNNMLSEFQSGFRRSHSTATALTKILDDIHLAVEVDGFSVAVLLDFTKAFDSMSHALLLRKLKNNYGFSSTACRLIGSFLAGRSQRVVVNNETSSVSQVTSGSPQGSILSPILFACFINDIKDYIRHCRFHLYADDLQIYTVGLGNLQQAISRVNSDLIGIRQWTDVNSLKLNASKTQGIIFSRSDLTAGADPIKVGGDTIPYSSSVRNLGLFVDYSLSWESQVSRVVSRVYGTLRLLSRFRNSMSMDLRMYLVRSLVIPIFLYSDVVYFPSLTNVAFRRLELAFNACIRYIFNLRRFDHISELEGEILGCGLFTYLEIRLAVFIHRISLYSAPPYLSAYLRFGPSPRHRLFVMPTPVPRTSLRGDSTVYRGLRLWNFLPPAAKQCRSIESFKREAGRFLGELAELSRPLRHQHHHHQIY
jgi:retron-type reverse transcriptase